MATPISTNAVHAHARAFFSLGDSAASTSGSRDSATVCSSPTIRMARVSVMSWAVSGLTSSR